MNCEERLKDSEIDYRDPYTSEALYLLNSVHGKDRIDMRWMYYEILEKPELFRYLSSLKKQQFLWRLTRVLKALNWTKASGKNAAFWIREYNVRKPRNTLKIARQMALSGWLEGGGELS
jgi:hypothetical protein